MRPDLQFHLTDRHFTSINELIKSCLAWESALERSKVGTDFASRYKRVINELSDDFNDDLERRSAYVAVSHPEISEERSISAIKQPSRSVSFSLPTQSGPSRQVNQPSSSRRDGSDVRGNQMNQNVVSSVDPEFVWSNQMQIQTPQSFSSQFSKPTHPCHPIPSVSSFNPCRSNGFFRSRRPTRLARAKIYWQRRKKARAFIVASIFGSETNDPRLYVDVLVDDVPYRGLLDSGASVSVLGCGSEKFVSDPSFHKFPSVVHTASGHSQPVLGYVRTTITFKGMIHYIPLYVVPSLEQELYLGMDFWRKFDIVPFASAINSPSEEDIPVSVKPDRISFTTTKIVPYVQVTHRGGAHRYKSRNRSRVFHVEQPVFNAPTAWNGEPSNFNAKINAKYKPAKTRSRVGNVAYSIEDWRGNILS